MKNNLFVRLLLTLLLLAPFAASTLATGYYGPMFYLDQGGANVAASPEFYWELEVKRLAREFHPPEKLFEAPLTFVADETDFAAALREGKIKPADPDEAMRQHRVNRSVVEGANPAGTETLQATFASDLAQQIQSGTYRVTDYLQAGGPQVTTKKIALRLPPRGRSRLTSSEVEPNRRFHYRYLASALALRAAALLPNDSEELADVVNCAGLWVKNTHEKLGSRYYQVLERRAANTTIGQAATARHWFVDERGPWSDAETEAHEALRKELNFPPEN